MAHWAEIDENDIVVRVLVMDNDHPDGQEGYTWLTQTLGGTWLKTSYNTIGGVHLEGGEPLRKNFAGIGYTYDNLRDAFISPKPFESWILNEETCQWEAPIEYPTDGADYQWNESIVNWELVETEEE